MRLADEDITQILKWRATDIFGRPFSYILPVDAHDRVQKLFEEGALLEGVVFPRVPLRFKPGGFINFDMKMTRLEEDNQIRLDFYKPSVGEGDTAKDAVDTDTFFTFVEQMIASPYEGELDLTMVDVSGLRDDAISDAAGKDAEYALRSSIEKALKAEAVGGTIGRLDDASYALLSAGDFDKAEFEAEIAEVAKGLDIDEEAVGLRSGNITIDDRDVSAESVQRALNHARGVFLGEIESKDDHNSLSDVISGIEHHRRLIRDAIDAYKYRCSEREIRDGEHGNRLVSKLQEGKVVIDGWIRSPDELIVMKDHPDLASLHDLKQLDEMIRMRMRANDDDRRVRDFYGLNIAALLSDGFFEELQEIFVRHGELRELVGFRLRGLPAAGVGGESWAALKKLIDLGHRVWIDRFSDVVTDQEKPGWLKDGFVEMPRAMMDRLIEHPDGAALIRDLIKVWGESGVSVIAADLITYKRRVVANSLGIRIFLAEEDFLDEDERESEAKEADRLKAKARRRA